jgi:TonB-linked SusC/RagA family outer membrane protein
LFFILNGIFHSYSQKNDFVEIKGQVLDEKTNEALPGASLLLTNEKAGSVSDQNGNFIINAQSLPVTLSVRFLGYKSTEIIITKYSEPIVVLLQEDAGLLDEIVVVGYGTQRRKELTGSVSSVSKPILEHPTISLDGLLGGAIAGLSTTQTSGQPGVSSSVRIRGGNSITANNDPLYVIDGFLFYNDNASTSVGLRSIESSLNPLSSINPSDIESIDVLKDISATAIYGSRGANGVILVTTKKGTRNAGSVSYQYSAGWDNPVKKLDLLNASQWARMQKDYFFNKGRFTDEEIEQLGAGYNWQDAVLKTGSTQTHELSLSGGNDNLRYLVSGNYTDQKGIIINSGFQRYNGRVNLEKNVTDKLTLGITATAGKSTQDALTTFREVNYSSSPFGAGITNSLTYALYIPPVVPIYVDGDYNYHNPYEYGYLVYNGKTANPVSDLKNSQGQTINTTLLGNFFARYTIIEGLIAKFNAGTYISHVTQNFFAPSYTAIGLETNGIGGIGNKRQEVTQMEYLLTYTKQISENHLIDLLAGYTYQDTKNKYVTSITSQFSSEKLGVNDLAAGSAFFAPISEATEAKLFSMLGRINYTLLGRYNLTSTLRGDKSTRFSRNPSYKYFPSVGLSWNINEESFLRDVRKLSNLKLRLSYGIVGNQEIGDYEYAQKFTAGRYNGEVVYIRTNLGNENLKWETTAGSNVGIDIGLLNNRLSFVVDGYYKKTSDLLVNVPVDPSSVVKTQLFNVGNVTNRGLEFTANVVVVDRKNFKWSLSANIARNINKITNLGDNKQIVLGNDGEEILEVGESLGSFYGLKFEGIVQKGEDVSSLPKTPYGTAQPGDIKIADVSGPNGIPDNEINSYDRVVLGSIQPKFTYGLQTTLDYRGFDLFIFLQGSQGNKLYNHLRRYLESPNDAYNASAALLNSWTAENPSNTLPGLANLANDRSYGTVDSRYVEDASFLKLKNITLGYTVKQSFIAARLRIFASAQNLFVITGYKGYDPEVSRGIDLGAYPTARTFSLGARITY